MRPRSSPVAAESPPRHEPPAASIAWLPGILLLLLSACAGSTAPALDPGEVRFDPRHLEATVDLHNPGPGPLAVSGLRIEGEDWIAFQITDERNPDRIAPGGHAQIHLRVDRKVFRSDAAASGDAPGGAVGYASYRSGRAELRLSIDHRDRAVPLRFEPGPTRAAAWLPALLATLLSFGLAGTALHRGSPRPTHTSPPRGPWWSRAREPMVLGLALLGLAILSLPTVRGVCTGSLWIPAGPLALAQCRDGLGGGPGSVLTGPLAPAAWVFALSMAPALTDRDGPAPARAVGPMLAALAVGAALAAATLEARTLDPHSLLLAQHGTWMLPGTELSAPGWLLLRLPVPAVLATLACARIEPALHSPVMATAWDLLAAAVLALAFLGGLHPPLPTHWPHALVLLADAIGFAAATLVVATIVRRLRARRATAGTVAAGPGPMTAGAALWLLAAAGWAALTTTTGA